MRFTRLRLNGFKSFVDPTDLMIAEGLTGVVGPNGCGKSNLLEALRWVMGESRPTAMRGGGMDDVIFAGAATRPARAFAEVALTIDNRERLAPAAFNTEDTLEIARRITRDAGSAYKVGGKDMRARDVQMLFADAATGAHSTALVRQGQVAEIINAKPRARRRVLEEAAGISGLYQRRHEAELKLNAADVNLARVGDMIESLAARIQSLARQARQARRYREIAADLRRAEGLLLYLRWLAADRARADADAAMGLAETAASQAQRQVRSAATARSEAEASMPDLREEATIAGAVMNRVQIESATLADEAKRVDAAIAGLAAQIAELDRNMARERDLAGDAEANIARLDAEAADLATAETGAVAQLADIEAAAEAAGQALATREADLSAITDAHARHVARAQAAEARLAEAQEAARRGRIAAAQAKEAADDTASRLSASAEGADAARSALAAAQAQAEAAEAALRAADAARIQAATQEAEARAARTEAEGHAKALDTEVRALSQLLEAGRGQESKIIDAVEVAPGYEAALGAALGDDLDAPPARHAGGIGWSALPAYVPPPALPKGVVALSQFVSGPDALSRRLGQIGVVAAEDGAALQPALSPGQRLVSRAGDLWRWDGFAKAAADAGSDVGRRLEQINRRDALAADLERAEQAAARARQAHAQITDRAAAAAAAEAQARTARQEADRRVAEVGRTANRQDAERTMLEGRIETLRHAARQRADDVAAAEAEMAQAAAAMVDLGDADALTAELAAAQEATAAARAETLVRRTAAAECRSEIESRARRAASLSAERADWAARREQASAHIAELERRRATAQQEQIAAAKRPDEIARRRAALSDTLTKAEARKTAAEDALAAGEATLRARATAERDAERAASDAREARAALAVRRDAAQEAVDAARTRIAEDLGTDPATLAATVVADNDLPDLSRAEADVARLRRQRDALGAVNLRAEEDARAVQDEHDALTAEKADLEAAIAKLRAAISALNKEGRERLLAAFDEVNGKFARLFATLFGGGEAKLVLLESADPLEAGLEILCQPPGKKLSTLSLLSGGEQTLTALSLIFAVFLAHPAPICVLDEVDAPLDDANVGRFCDLLDQMRRETDTRFLIITHHAVTMSRMDRLFGVTMAEQGVSQLVSVDLSRAEQMVA